MERNQVQKHRLVRFKEGYVAGSLAGKYLAEEDVIYIADGHIYNDTDGYNIFLRSGSGCNSCDAYLHVLVLDERPVEDLPYYKVTTNFGKPNETSQTFLFIIDAHHCVNTLRNNSENYSLKLERWQLINGVQTKLEFQ